MSGPETPVVDTDLLVIGSGFAGLWAALTARECGVDRVALVDKGDIGRSSQSRMSAGATIYLLPEDDPDVWVRDVAAAQRYLSRQDMVADMLASSHDRLRRLEQWGVGYASSGAGYLRLPSRGFEHIQMLVRPTYRDHVGGAAVVMALRRQVIRRQVRRHVRTAVTDLVTGEGGRVAGAVGFDRSTGEPVLFSAGAVILASGDCGFRGNYAGTDSATGDAYRLAFDSGARLSHMEFLCSNTGSPSFGFEGTGVALRYGGRLLDSNGEPFVERFHPEGDLAEVGALVQAMSRAAEDGYGPPFYLDLSGGGENSFLRLALESMGGFMPLNLSKLVDAGVDVFAQPQEWVPAIQTLRGGVRTGVDCASDVPGLYVAGTAQALDPGLFNGWSSCRAMWSGEKAGASAAAFIRDAGSVKADLEQVTRAVALAVGRLGRDDGVAADEVIGRLQTILAPHHVSILKDDASLRSALRSLDELESNLLARIASPDPHELGKAHEAQSLVLAARLFLTASLTRTESRGDHCRRDHPEVDNRRWLCFVNLSRNSRDDLVVETEPVPFGTYPFDPLPRSERAS